SCRCPWQDGGHAGRGPPAGQGLGAFATGSPRPVESRNRNEAGLLACTLPASAGSDDAFPRLGAVAVSFLSVLTVAGAAAASPRSRLSFAWHGCHCEEPRSG